MALPILKAAAYAALFSATLLVTMSGKPAGAQSPMVDVSPVAAQVNDTGLPTGWSHRASFIEIFVRSYKDSNGDGIGDLNGLTSQLDYLKSLGITGIWLMPIMPSTDHDHGYAVADYRAIDPDYGTIDDFRRLIREAHKRGIGIIMDYVMNHAGSSNPIFESAKSSKASPYRDWFLFSDVDPKWKNGGWRPLDRQNPSNGYFYGIFDTHMPDWNLTNPRVVAYHADTLRYWLNMGVDGFRFDAVTMFVENGPDAYLDQPQNKTILKTIRDVIDAYPNRYMICEASETPAAYVASGACDNTFAFKTQPMIKSSAQTGRLDAGLIAQLSRPEADHMPLILGNHDSFAGDRAIADLSGHDEGDYRVAAAIYLLSSATPFTYYGEEIGMSNNGAYNDTGLRAPMSWSAELPAAGFSTVAPYRRLATNYQNHNVAAEQGDDASLLETYRAFYRVRQVYPVLSTGAMKVQSKAGDSALIFTRTGSSASDKIAVLINLSDQIQTLSVDVGQKAVPFVEVLLKSSDTQPAAVLSSPDGHLSISVAAKSAAVLVPAK